MAFKRVAELNVYYALAQIAVWLLYLKYVCASWAAAATFPLLAFRTMFDVGLRRRR